MITLLELDQMYLVACIGDWFGGNVEAFSHTPNGPVEVIYVYDQAMFVEFIKALNKANELDVPLLLAPRN